MKVMNLASRPLGDFSRFDTMGMLEAIKNSAHDNQHEHTNYYRLTYETLRSKLSVSSDDKDQAKVLEIIAKVEKNEN
jgi:hypothetical protein